MAITPCLVVGGKPLDVESSGFFFIINLTDASGKSHVALARGIKASKFFLREK